MKCKCGETCELSLGYFPYNEEHCICPKCDSTYVIGIPERSKREDLCNELLDKLKKNYEEVEIDIIFTEEDFKKEEDILNER